MNLNRLALNNVLRDKWTYFAYFISSVFSICIFFCFSVVSFHPKLSVIQAGSSLSLAMLVGNVLIYCFSFIFISYSIRAFMKSREKSLGLFVIMGASNKQLNKMVFKENMIIGIAAIFTAIIIGLVFSPLFLLIGKNIMSIEGFSMYLPIMAIAITFVMFTMLFLTISLASPFFIRKNNIINLFKSDKTDEKEIKFSYFGMFIGSLIFICSIYIIIFGSKNNYVKEFMGSEIGYIVTFIGILIGGYILYRQIAIVIVSYLKKTKLYFRKTNMIIISDMKSKLRSNTNIMYLITILFSAAFYIIIFLYALSADVEESVKKINPYNFTYVSFNNDAYEEEHIKLIENTLKGKAGYEKYSYTLKFKEKTAVIMSESDYNTALRSIGSNEITLKNNEIYIVSGLSKEIPKKDINENVKAIFNKEGIEAVVVGISEKNITPSGVYTRILIVSDQMMKKFGDNEGFYSVKYYGFNISKWKEETKVSEDIISKIKSDDQVHEYTLMSTEKLYLGEKISKNIALFVGFSLSIIFIISGSSMIYFKLCTELEKECNKFKGIIKLGLSKKELSKIISTQIFIIMFVPFIISIIALYMLGITPLGQGLVKSYFTVLAVCTVIFLVLQILGYLGVNIKYKEAVLKKVM